VVSGSLNFKSLDPIASVPIATILSVRDTTESQGIERSSSTSLTISGHGFGSSVLSDYKVKVTGVSDLLLSVKQWVEVP
jgi:hypothetical protein